MIKTSLVQKQFCRRPPIASVQDYLLCLGRCLLPYFPLPQVQEVILDYQEYLFAGKERGLADDALLQSLDSPEKITLALLEESPGQKSYRWRQKAPWLLLLAASFFLFRYFDSLTSYPLYAAALLLFLGTVSFACFELMQGWGLASIERQFSKTFILSRPFLWLQLFLPAAAAFIEYGIQRLLSAPHGSIPTHVAGMTTGTLCSRILFLLMIICILSAVWALLKTRRDSVRYYVGAIHAAGAFLTFWDIRNILHSMDPMDEGMMRHAFLCSLLFYFAGLIISLLLAASLRMQKAGHSPHAKEV